MGDAVDIRDEMQKNNNEVKASQKLLTDMVTKLVITQTQTNAETSTRLDTLEGKSDDIEKRLEKMENTGTIQVEHTHRATYDENRQSQIW